MINKEIDVYQPPSRSLASRIPSARSRGSSRGLITAHLPADSGPRYFWYESKLEQKVFYLLAGRRDVFNIHEQSAPISYRNRRGRPQAHYPDFLLTKRCGTRLAIAVKPHGLVESTGFRDELALVRKNMPLSYAKELVLITEKSFVPCEARNAERFHEFRRHADPDADALILDLLANLKMDTTIASLVAASGLEGRGFRTVFRAIYNGLAKYDQERRHPPVDGHPHGGQQMTMRFRLSPTDCVSISGIEHRVQSQCSSGIILERVEDPGINRSYTHEEFMDLLAAPDVSLRRGEFSATSAARRLRCDTKYLSSLSTQDSDQVLWRAAWVETFLQAERQGEVKRTERSVSQILPALTEQINDAEYRRQYSGKWRRAGFELKSRQAPCPKSLLSWVRQYEEHGATPLALMRKLRSPSSFHVHFRQEEKELLAECVANYLDRGRPTKTKIADDTRRTFTERNTERALHGTQPLRIPSTRTVERRIAQLDPFETAVQRHGLEYAKRKFSFYEDGITAEHPMQRIEMDDWEIDVMSLLGESGALDRLSPAERARFDVGRRWLCLAIDCATRCVVGFRLTEKPETTNALATLRLITQDKSPISQAANCDSSWDQYGGIGILVTDQGSTFVANMFRTAVADAGGTYEAASAGVAKLRARVERMFRTLGQQLAPMLTGRTFGNPQERGDYPSEELAALTDDELAQVITLFIVDIYHNSQHAGLGGETPANAWKRLAAEQGVTPPPDSNGRRVLFGLELERKLGRHGVRVFGINYTNAKLQELLLHGRQREVKIRVDPHSLTYVAVLIGKEWHPAEAVNQGVDGLSLDEWQSIVRNLRTGFKDDARFSVQTIWSARKKIKTIDARARALRQIMPSQWTTADLERAERHLFMGLRIGPEGTCASGTAPVGTGDLLDDVIHPPEPISPTDHGDDADTPPDTDTPPRWRISRD